LSSDIETSAMMICVQQADDLEKLHRECSEHDTQKRGRGDTEHHDAPALLNGQAGHGYADHDGVVPCQDEVHDHDLRQRHELGHRDEIHSEALCPFAGVASLPVN
jgi:hypothetical protein